jgi:hypothetical protein
VTAVDFGLFDFGLFDFGLCALCAFSVISVNLVRTLVEGAPCLKFTEEERKIVGDAL